MLKRTQPCSEAVRIEKLRDKLRSDIRLNDYDRRLAIEKLQQNISHRHSISESQRNPSPSKRDQSSQTLPYISKSSNTSFPDENEYFWFLENGNTEDLIAKLKLLAKKSCRNEKKIKLLMDRTFIKRRDFLLRLSPRLSEMKELYPALFSLNEMKHEFARIFHRGLCDLFYYKVKKYSKRIIKLTTENKYSAAGTSISEDILESAVETTKEAEKTIRITRSLLLLCQLLEEQKFTIYSEMEHHSEYPYILAPSERDVLLNNKTMKVVVENVTICESASFLDAVLCMISSFFIFHICYPKIYYKTLVAIEKLYLEDLETDDVPEEVENLLCMLKK